MQNYVFFTKKTIHTAFRSEVTVPHFSRSQTEKAEGPQTNNILRITVTHACKHAIQRDKYTASNCSCTVKLCVNQTGYGRIKCYEIKEV